MSESSSTVWTAGRDGQSASPLVAISIINWKGLEDTQACCESLARLTYRNARVFVSDNASGDGSAETLRANFPQFTHVANSDNLGFSGGNNAIIRRACAEGFQYVLLLNNDTVVDPDFLTAMVQTAEADAGIGMIGAKIYYSSDPKVIWYAGGAVDFAKVFSFSQVGQSEIDHGQHDLPGETEWVTGCCLMVRTALVKEVGLLDESFGYYYEDVDWCLRARQKGWRIWYEPRAKLWHKIGRSVARANLPLTYYGSRNSLLVARRSLNWRKRMRLYAKTIKRARRRDDSDPEKASLIRGTVHGILGLRGLETELQAGWWRFLEVLVAKRWR